MSSPNRGDADGRTAAIIELERRRYAAMLSADMSTLDELCAPELLYTHSNAERDDKASYLEKVATRHFDYLEIEHETEQVTFAGGCAVVAGQMRAKVTLGGAEKHLNNSATAVWVETDGSWALLTYTPTVNPR